jgi:predicted site-specific integrase-resolvase
MASKRIITEPDFAERVNLSLSTVRRKRKRGELQYVELSDNRIGYTDEYADEYIDAHTVQPKTATAA